MSQIAMYSGVYDEIREYAELLDKVLMDLKGGTSGPQDENRQRLAELLTSLATPGAGDLSIRVISFLLRDDAGVDPAELAKIGKLLKATSADNSMIEPLERLAQSLQQEQAVTMARMRMRG
jgi:hypothetical protein